MSELLSLVKNLFVLIHSRTKAKISFFVRVGNWKTGFRIFKRSDVSRQRKGLTAARRGQLTCNRSRKLLSIRKGRLPEQLCSYELLKSINYHKDDWIFNRSFRVFEPPAKNFQQVFHYHFHLRQRCRCFCVNIDWRGWLIKLACFHLPALSLWKICE